MKQYPEQESQLRQYLLGELRLEEQVLIEQRLFLERDYAELAQSVEDDLIDDYVHNDLTAVERQKFEIHFLKTPEHREDLRIAQAFQTHLASELITPYVASQILQPVHVETRGSDAPSTTINHEEQPAAFLSAPHKRKPVVWFALAAAVLIVLPIATWISVRSISKLSKGLEAKAPQPVPTEPPKQQHGPSPAVNDNSGGRVETVERRGTDGPNKKPTNDQTRPQPEQKTTPSTFAAVTIYPGGSSRGVGQTNQVTITPGQTDVDLKLPLPARENYERYRVELLGGQRRIHTQTLESKPDEKWGRVILVKLPVRLLTEQHHEIKLLGIGTPGGPTTYFFTVKKEQ